MCAEATNLCNLSSNNTDGFLMEQWKQKKSLFFFIIIFMLFLGMCVENIQADSFFSYESSAHSASTLLSGKRITLTSQEYKVESYSKNDFFTNSCSVIRRPFSRSNKSTALSLLFVDILPLIFPFIQTSCDYELTDESSCSTVIIHYIHRKDGKKA